MTEDQKLLEVVLRANHRIKPFEGTMEWDQTAGLWLNGVFWDPLEDDGDCFRLAAAHNVNITHWSFMVPEAHRVSGGIGTWNGPDIPVEGDVLRAARRAVVAAVVMYQLAYEAQVGKGTVTRVRKGIST